ncbi:hypothetical protein ACJJIF_21275 [Microbulbifer sp. SSSA002]|uniref:hypothetical protein n=1 Tax=Microbulbifer sp. SSSA002 TaxID=3243376 RepID=UPI00403A5249
MLADEPGVKRPIEHMRKLQILIVTMLLSACGEIGFYNQSMLPLSQNLTQACLEHAASKIEVDEFGPHQYEGAKAPTYFFTKGNMQLFAQEKFEPEHMLNISYSYMESCPCPGKERRLKKNEAFLKEVTAQIKQSCHGLLTSQSTRTL